MSSSPTLPPGSGQSASNTNSPVTDPNASSFNDSSSLLSDSAPPTTPATPRQNTSSAQQSFSMRGTVSSSPSLQSGRNYVGIDFDDGSTTTDLDNLSEQDTDTNTPWSSPTNSPGTENISAQRLSANIRRDQPELPLFHLSPPALGVTQTGETMPQSPTSVFDSQDLSPPPQPPTLRRSSHFQGQTSDNSLPDDARPVQVRRVSFASSEYSTTSSTNETYLHSTIARWIRDEARQIIIPNLSYVKTVNPDHLFGSLRQVIRDTSSLSSFQRYTFRFENQIGADWGGLTREAISGAFAEAVSRLFDTSLLDPNHPDANIKSPIIGQLFSYEHPSSQYRDFGKLLAASLVKGVKLGNSKLPINFFHILKVIYAFNQTEQSFKQCICNPKFLVDFAFAVMAMDNSAMFDISPEATIDNIKQSAEDRLALFQQLMDKTTDYFGIKRFDIATTDTSTFMSHITEEIEEVASQDFYNLNFIAEGLFGGFEDSIMHIDHELAGDELHHQICGSGLKHRFSSEDKITNTIEVRSNENSSIEISDDIVNLFKDHLINWISQLSEPDLEKVCQTMTGSPGLDEPLLGQPIEEKHRLNFTLGIDDTKFDTCGFAHTCFNTIDFYFTSPDELNAACQDESAIQGVLSEQLLNPSQFYTHA